MKVASNNSQLELKEQEAAHLKKLLQRQRNLITQKENEISSLDKMYEQKKDIVKGEGQLEIFNQTEKNRIDVENSLINKEQQLEKIKQDLVDSSSKFELQKEFLDNDYKEKFEHMNTLHSNNLVDFAAQNEDQARDMAMRTNFEIKELSSKNNEGISNAIYEAKLKSNEIVTNNNRNLESLKHSLKDDEKNVLKSQDEIIKQIEKDHQASVQELTTKGKIEVNERNKMNEAKIQNEEVQHQDILKQKRISFEQKYNELEKNHTQILSRLKERLDSQIKEVVDAYSAEKNLVDSRSSDNFYKVTKFDPIIRDEASHYIISIPIAEHEKELVNLTAQNRDVIVTLNRKFTDKVEDEISNETYKTSRSEVLTKKLKVTDLMDSKKMTTNYENGFLNFKIQKM